VVVLPLKTKNLSVHVEGQNINSYRVYGMLLGMCTASK